MSILRKRVEEMASVMAEQQLEEVVDFMAFLLAKQDKALFEGLSAASESSLLFWNTPEDEVWDHV